MRRRCGGARGIPVGVDVSDRCVSVSLAVLCLMLSAGAVHAETTVSASQPIAIAASAVAGQAAQPATATATGTATIHPTAGTSVATEIHAHDLAAFQTTSHKPAVPTQLTAQVMAALTPSDPTATAAAGALAAGTATPSATPAPPVGSDVTGGEARGATRPATSILDLRPLNRVAEGTMGLSTGQLWAVPDAATLSRDTAAAILRAFHGAPGTADQAASDAADTAATGDPDVDERVALARTVFKVDGTDSLVRHYVSTVQMRIIINEVAKNIDFNKLSETDKYRLSAIAATAQTQLEDKILNLDARAEANYLTKQDLTLLIVAYDNDAMRKQTALRLADTGKGDSDDALDLNLAQIQIVKAFESAR